MVNFYIVTVRILRTKSNINLILIGTLLHGKKKSSSLSYAGKRDVSKTDEINKMEKVSFFTLYQPQSKTPDTDKIWKSASKK